MNKGDVVKLPDGTQGYYQGKTQGGKALVLALIEVDPKDLKKIKNPKVH